MAPFLFSVSALRTHISVVISRCADKQMRRIYTSPVVAVVADVHAFRDDSAMQRERKPMHQPPLTVNAHHSIAVRAGVAGPVPAASSFFNLLPKTRDAVIAPAFLELGTAGRGVRHPDVVIVSESNGLEGSEVERRDHRSTPALTGDARHREDFGASFVVTRYLVGPSCHGPIITNV